MKKTSTSVIANKIPISDPSWAGDMVMVQSLFITLNTIQPENQIDVLAPGWTLSLLARKPEILGVIAMPLTHGQFGFPDRIKFQAYLPALFGRSYRSYPVPDRNQVRSDSANT